MTELKEMAIRITSDNDEALRLFAKQYIGIWCKEEADLEKHCNSTHYHGYIKTKLTKEGIKKQIYNYFQTPNEDRGNKTLAFTKVKEIEGCFRYICKGTEKTYANIVYNDILGPNTRGAHNINVNDETIYPDDNHYYDTFWDVNKKLHQEVKERRDLKKTAKANFKDYFINEVLPTYDNNKCKLTQNTICHYMYDYYVEHDKELPSKMQGQIIVNDLYLRYTCPQDKLKNEILFVYGFVEYYDR